MYAIEFVPSAARELAALLYRIEDDRLIVLVIKIGHRRDIYR